MRRTLYTILSAMLLSVFTFSTASAGAVRISGVGFALGSLIVTGNVEGLDPHQRAKITLEAHAELQGVQCIRGDEVVEIGDLPFDVSATQRIKAGRHGDGVQPFEFEVSPKLDPRGLCPSGHDGESSRRGHNKKWRVEIGFVNWTSANLLAVDAQDDSNFDHADFVCETTPECITCHQEDSVD